MTLRTLALTTSFPRYSGDLQGCFVAAWAQALADLGAEIQVLAPDSGDWAPKSVVRCGFKTFGARLSCGGAPDRLFSSRGLSRLLSLNSACCSSLSLLWSAWQRAPQFDAVVGHWLCPCGLVAALAGRGARRYAYAHGGDVALLEAMPAGRQLARFLGHSLDGITFVSAQLRDRFLKLSGPCKASLAVLSMGVQTPYPDPLSAKRFLQRAAGRPVVATVGRLVKLKGYDLLAEALSGIDALWIAAGEGGSRAELEEICLKNRVDVWFAGQLLPKDRDALLSVASLFVAPSRPLSQREEGMPVSVLEAMVQGVPVVAAKTGGIAELEGQTGVSLVPPNDKKSLKSAILEALSRTGGFLRDQMRAEHARYLWSALGPAHLERLTVSRR